MRKSPFFPLTPSLDSQLWSSVIITIMEVVSASQMLAIEKQAVKEQRLSIKELMAAAGKKVADLADRIAGGGGEIAIYCGKGNNGGDGFVAAGHLIDLGYKVKVFLIEPAEKIGGIAKEALAGLENSGVSIRRFDQNLCPSPDLIIDAVFGFSLKGEVRGAAAAAIDQINRIKAPVISVDVPSGINADSGKIAGVAVKADHTVTFTRPKLGLVLSPGALLAGNIHTADIGIFSSIIKQRTDIHLATREMIKDLLPRRDYTANKHDCGKVLVVAASAGMTGAAAMTAAAAIRSGAGIVTLAVPESLSDILEIKLTEVMTVPLPDTGAGSVSEAAVDKVKELSYDFDVVALGPGLGRHQSTVKFIRSTVESLKKAIVLDADGLNAVAGSEVLRKRKPATVVTPHEGELSGLIGLKATLIAAERLASCQAAADKLKATVVLKGNRSLISGHGVTMINPTGNPGMATAGTGDVLTGVIAAMMAQGLPDYPAAVAGTFIHGLAGDLASEKHGCLAMIATDLIDCLPDAIKEVSR